jgi:hypothetical protein
LRAQSVVNPYFRPSKPVRGGLRSAQRNVPSTSRTKFNAIETWPPALISTMTEGIRIPFNDNVRFNPTTAGTADAISVLRDAKAPDRQWPASSFRIAS